MSGWSSSWTSPTAVAWSASTGSTFNWNVLTSNVSSTDSLGIMFSVTADDEHAVIAIDDQSGWRSTDTVFNEP